MTQATETATALAKALDAEDYPTARAFLRDDCNYEIRGETIEGAEAIIASYQTNGEAGRERFDDISYESSVEEISPSEALIGYVDIISHGNCVHIHTCAQQVTIDDAGKVAQITHVDHPGQREMLEAFKNANP